MTLHFAFFNNCKDTKIQNSLVAIQWDQICLPKWWICSAFIRRWQAYWLPNSCFKLIVTFLKQNLVKSSMCNFWCRYESMSLLLYIHYILYIHITYIEHLIMHHLPPTFSVWVSTPWILYHHPTLSWIWSSYLIPW